MKTIAGALKKGRNKKLKKPTLRPFTNGPEGYVSVSESGKAYTITTLCGTKVAFDMCGRCGIHVIACKCQRGPSLPRGVEYIWDQDEALSKGEEWDHHHPNYRGSFTAREAKRNLRFTMPAPSFELKTSTEAKPPKSLALYAKRATKMRERGVKRLLKGKRS